MVRDLMLDLFVNHIVEDYPAIDYIAIKTKKGGRRDIQFLIL